MSCIDNIGAAVGGAVNNTCLRKVMLGLDDSIGSGLHRVIEKASLLQFLLIGLLFGMGGVCDVGRKGRIRSEGRC